jgi:hypothetical protein
MLGKKSGGEVFSREKAEEKRFRERRVQKNHLNWNKVLLKLTYNCEFIRVNTGPDEDFQPNNLDI